jgi:hypothetical protein
MNREQYKKSANKYCLKTLGFECFEEDDPYELEELVDGEMFNLSPKDFVYMVFEEDFTSREYDDYLRRESEEYYENDLDTE